MQNGAAQAGNAPPTPESMAYALVALTNIVHMHQHFHL
eukprot:CAMPEP_0174378608 /NCGR_PEP_ID=MMETSP0811_2-20130205/122157_1 /TAXON_ID=73025 ORGANISM="Eutreptiella gymnastica-like, Strain CCMP1594" /NCGR_SAMPLE_ID=MMETSP0811_2 /ASSEMBLY_ACC=CAM_ASM_000667 /LENGTH=37 /DNA_ID= /DNA_START= /DNA_END= /DNA_ORIENTATION=